MKTILFLLLSSLTLQAITLQKAIEMGLKNNPDILIKQNNILLSLEAKNLKKTENFGGGLSLNLAKNGHRVQLPP